MTQSKRLKSRFNRKDLYESAWEAIQKESEVYDLSHWKSEGWKPVTDFPISIRRRMRDRLNRNLKFESTKQKVRLPYGIREITLFRPVITNKSR